MLFFYKCIITTMCIMSCISAFGQSQTPTYNGNLIPYQDVSGKWGYLEAGTGKVAIPAIYDEVGFFKGNTAFVYHYNPNATSNNDFELAGLIDTSGKELFPVVHTLALPVKTRAGEELDDLCYFSGDGGWGIGQTNGKWLIAPGEFESYNEGYPNYEFYDRESVLVNNETYIEKGQTYRSPAGYRIDRIDRDNRLFYITPKNNRFQLGLSDWHGNIILPAAYLEIRVHAERNRIIASKDRTFSDDDMELTARLDEEGEENLDEIDSKALQDLMAKLRQNEAENSNLENHLFDLSGKEIAKFHSRYYPNTLGDVMICEGQGMEDGNYFSLSDGSLIPSHQAGLGDWHIFREYGLYGLANPEGSIVLPAQYEAMRFYGENRIVVPDLDAPDYWHQFLGVINTKGEVIVPFEYRELWPMENSQSYIALHKDHNGFGLVDANGSTVVPFVYEGHLSFSDGLAEVRDSAYNKGIIDTLGREIIPLEYSNILQRDTPDGNIYFMVEKDGLWGIFDQQGKAIVPIAYGSVSTINEYLDYGIVVISSSDLVLQGFVNLNSGTIVEPKYSNISPLGAAIEATLPGESAERYELLDLEGNLLPGGPYFQIRKGSSGDAVFIAVKKAKYGVLNKDGNVLLPFVYDSLTLTRDGLFRAEKNGREFFVNGEGREYIMD